MLNKAGLSLSAVIEMLFYCSCFYTHNFKHAFYVLDFAIFVKSRLCFNFVLRDRKQVPFNKNSYRFNFESI